MFVHMAWRNIWRMKKRTAITSGTVGFGVLLCVFSTGVAESTYRQMINDSARAGLGHLTIEPPDYRDAPSAKKRIPLVQSTRNRVLKEEGVKAVLARIYGSGVFGSARKTRGGLFWGVDPKLESPDTNIFYRGMVAGKTLEDPDSREIVVGQKLLDSLRLKLGRKLVVTTVDREGEMVSELFRVSGVFKTGVEELDGAVVLLPIDRARKMLGYVKDEATMISVYVDDHRKAQGLKARLAPDVNSEQATVLSWRETQSELANLSDLDRSMDYLFLTLLGLVITAGLLNTVLMSVFERRREFGVLLALGLRPFQLVRLVLTESVLVAGFGLIIGGLLMIPLGYYMKTTGLDLSEMMGNHSAVGVLVDPILKIEFYAPNLIGISVALVLLSLAAAAYPAVAAARLDPASAMKDN